MDFDVKILTWRPAAGTVSRAELEMPVLRGVQKQFGGATGRLPGCASALACT